MVPRAVCGLAHPSFRNHISSAANCSDYLWGGRGEREYVAGGEETWTVPRAPCVHTVDLMLQRQPQQQRARTHTHTLQLPSRIRAFPLLRRRSQRFWEGVRGVEVEA